MMAEYINKEKLLKKAVTIPGYSEKILAEFDVEHAPAEDVVPVVRCRECKHHEDEEIGIVYCPNAIGGWVGEDWFCADGERKDGAE